MASVVGSASGETLAIGLLTGNVTITATTEATAQTVMTVAPVTYDGLAPVEIRFFGAAQLFPAMASCRFLLRRSDTGEVLGTIMRSAGANQNISLTVTAGTILTPPAGTYGLTMAGWITGGVNFTVQAGAGGPGDVLTPATLTVRSVWAVPAPDDPTAQHITQLVVWKDLLIGLTTAHEIWVLRGLNIWPTGSERRPLEWVRLNATVASEPEAIPTVMDAAAPPPDPTKPQW